MNSLRARLGTWLWFVLFFVGPLSHSTELEEKVRRMNEQLTNSFLSGPLGKIPYQRPDLSYDAALFSVVASLKSREPQRSTKWEETTFTNSSVIPKIRLRYREGSSPDAPIFVILPGSFATFKRGSFINSFVDHIDRIRPGSHLVAVDGALTPEFLEDNIRFVPWSLNRIARKIYSAVEDLRAQKGWTGKGGVAGFSSGANLAQEMMVWDAQTSNFLTLGGILVSPILHPLSSFENLDRRRGTVEIDLDKGLTTMDMRNLWKTIKHFGPPSLSDILAAVSDRNLPEFRDRFFNEFFEVDLKGVAEATGTRLENESYVDYFIYSGFGRYVLNRNENISRFEIATDLRPSLARLNDRPVFLFFANDDPVLSKAYDYQKMAEGNLRILEFAKKLTNYCVFNPPYGGHVGFVVDPTYPEIVTILFGKSDSNSKPSHK
jgi:hypothetical protein